MKDKKIQSYWNEKWAVVPFEDAFIVPHYEVSNYGRLKSFMVEPVHGKLIKGSVIQGYKSLNIKLIGGKNVSTYLHKLVADFFVHRPNEESKYVIHLDFDKLNNHFENLKWATLDEVIEHNRTNPAVLNRRIPERTSNYKLTVSKVRLIKKMLRNAKSRIKMIAKQFGVTHTQINRIKTERNWRNVKIDD